MRVDEWWKQLEREFAALAAEDPAFKNDEQFKIISDAIAEGVQLSGGIWHPFKDHQHGENIKSTLGQLKGVGSLPVIVCTDDAAHQRSIRLMAIYREHLKRYAVVHANLGDALKKLSLIIIDLDKLAIEMIGKIAHLADALSKAQGPLEKDKKEGEAKTSAEAKIEIKQQEQKVTTQKSPQQISTQINSINDSIDYYSGVLLILALDASRVAQQLQAISATLWVRVFSFFRSRTPQQKRLQRIQSYLHADKKRVNKELNAVREQRAILCKNFFIRRDELRRAEEKTCTIESITQQVEGWKLLDESSRNAVEKLLIEAFCELKPSSYDNQAQIGTALACKISQAMYDKIGFLSWRGGKGIYIETLGLAAQSFGHLTGAVVLSKKVLMDVIEEKGTVLELPSPKRVALTSGTAG